MSNVQLQREEIKKPLPPIISSNLPIVNSSKTEQKKPLPRPVLPLIKTHPSTFTKILNEIVKHFIDNKNILSPEEIKSWRDKINFAFESAKPGAIEKYDIASVLSSRDAGNKNMPSLLNILEGLMQKFDKKVFVTSTSIRENEFNKMLSVICTKLINKEKIENNKLTEYIDTTASFLTNIGNRFIYQANLIGVISRITTGGPEQGNLNELKNTMINLREKIAKISKSKNKI